MINEVARAMTKGEHTNARTYAHTYVRDRPYILSTTVLCEGIINEKKKNFVILSYIYGALQLQAKKNYMSMNHTIVDMVQ